MTTPRLPRPRLRPAWPTGPGAYDPDIPFDGLTLDAPHGTLEAMGVDLCWLLGFLGAALEAGMTLDGLQDALRRRESDEQPFRHREAMDRAYNPAAALTEPGCGCSTVWPARPCAHPGRE